MIPAWLQHHLQAIGADNPDGITRAARITRCQLCAAPVIRGLDDDRCAWSATADTTEIDEYGEYLAILAGRATYNLNKRGDQWQLDQRMQAALRANRTSPVIPAHKCGAQLPATKTPWPHRNSNNTTTSTQPPF